MDFKNRYTDYSNYQLIEIIEKSSDYQADAVNYAKELLDKRQLSIDEIEDIRLEIHTDAKEKTDRIEKRNEKRNIGLTFVHNLFDPFSNDKKVDFIKVIALMLFTAFIFKVYRVIAMIYFVKVEIDPSIILILIPIVFIGIIIYGIIKNSKYGFLMLIMYSTYSLFISFTNLLAGGSKTSQFEKIHYNESIGIDSMILLVSLTFLIYTGRPEIVKRFNANKKTFFVTLIVSVVVMIIVCLPAIIFSFQ
ncbi:hypothetical protein [Labilibaculum euxinus]|uniref:Uncharacterized protein n=1 Tax=Labilibaculum euxinus TaxID=2686357 RepID=A0A7M4D1D4_9BACT|nr:hypothetical protein [Labilibaculum euxinus]MUP36463.1 hypothetical protein [Labilibaculum euxinus]MVB05668.1 hypothetical protein [Labilibaculum euxinus]